MSTRNITALRVVPMVLISALTIFAVGAVWKTSAWFRQQPSQAITEDDSNEPLQNVRFTVYDVGIYPPSMQLKAGRVAIAFDDRTGPNKSFVVQRVNGNSPELVAQADPVPDHVRTRVFVKLTPGSYRVFSSEKPEIYSTLIVDR